jgi:hypothetical protein
MKTAELIDLAAKKVGGISALARDLKWDKGSIAGIKAGKRRLPPYRAAQLAQVLGTDEKAAYLRALADQADGAERTYWLGELKQRGAAIIAMLTFIATLALTVFPAQKAYANNSFPETATNIHYD